MSATSRQSRLLEVVQHGQGGDQLASLLNDTTIDINLLYGAPHFCTCLQWAAKHAASETVSALLSHGADTEVHDRRGLTALHHALEAGAADVFCALLDAGADVNAKNDMERSCLHVMAVKWHQRPAQHERMLARALAVPGVRLDDLCMRRSSALLLAASGGVRHMCASLVAAGADLEQASGGVTARQMIEQKFPDLLATTTVEEPVPRELGQLLYESLTGGLYDEFTRALRDIAALDTASRADKLNRRHGNFTCLEFAVNSGRGQYVRDLLEADAALDTVAPLSGFNVLHFACSQAQLEIVQLLLAAAKQLHGRADLLMSRDSFGRTVLHSLTDAATAASSADEPQDDLLRCMSLVLETDAALINVQDNMGNTALHLAAARHDKQRVTLLIRHGASLGLKNRFGVMPISRIQPGVLESALDAMLETNDAASATDHDFCVSIHYGGLIPPLNAYAGHSTAFSPEIEPLLFLSNSPEHRRLLHHPVVTSFLALKWSKVRLLYFTALALYSCFIALVTAYFCVELSVDPVDGQIRRSSAVSPAFSSMLALVIFLLALVYLAAEVSQMVLSCASYVRHAVNYLQLTLLCLLCVTVFDLGFEPVTRLHMAVWVILLAWLGFIVLLGQHPSFSIYVMMFKAVSKNFAKFLLMFSSLFCSFAFCFYLLFRSDEHFNTYWKSLLKTLVMSHGEMEYSSLAFSRSTYAGHFLFVVFLFVVALVFMNLLNGLAVADTGQIQRQAALHSTVSRVKLIFYIEQVLVSSRCRCWGSGSGTHKPCRLRHWLVSRLLLFPRCIKDKRVLVRPNASHGRFTTCQCHRFTLQEDIVEQIRELVSSRHQVDLHDKIQALDNKLDQLLKKVGASVSQNKS